MKIKSGYRIVVTSWENDGDNYKDVITDGLTETDLNFLLQIAANFSSRITLQNGYESNGTKTGNTYYDTFELMEIIHSSFIRNPHISPFLYDDFQIEAINDIFHAIQISDVNVLSKLLEMPVSDINEFIENDSISEMLGDHLYDLTNALEGYLTSTPDDFYDSGFIRKISNIEITYVKEEIDLPDLKGNFLK